MFLSTNKMLAIKQVIIYVFLTSTLLTNIFPSKSSESMLTYNGSPSEQRLWIRYCQKIMLDYIYKDNKLLGRRPYIDAPRITAYGCRFYYWKNPRVKMYFELAFCDPEWMVPFSIFTNCFKLTRPPRNTCNITGPVEMTAWLKNYKFWNSFLVDTGKCPISEPPKCDVTKHVVTNITSTNSVDSVFRSKVDFYCDNNELKYSEELNICKNDGFLLPPGTKSC